MPAVPFVPLMVMLPPLTTVEVIKGGCEEMIEATVMLPAVDRLLAQVTPPPVTDRRAVYE